MRSKRSLSLSWLFPLQPGASPVPWNPHFSPRSELKVGSPALSFLPATPSPWFPVSRGQKAVIALIARALPPQGYIWKTMWGSEKLPGTLASIWRGASGVWAFASGSRLLGVETEGLCQRQLWKPATGREAWCWAEEETRARGHARGPLLLRGLRKTLRFSHLLPRACLWAVLLTLGTIPFTKQNIWDFPGGPLVENLPADAVDNIRSLVWEDSTCCGATKPMSHNYWAHVLQPRSHSYWAHVLQLLRPACLEPVFCNKRGHQNEKP